MSTRLADRLKTTRHQQFVGRDLEKSFFQSILAADSPTQLLYVFGPGGIGKTTLLNEFIWLSEQSQVPVVYLDARQIEPSPPAFLKVLGSALHLDSQPALFETLARQSPRLVILLDTYEMFSPLDGWLRQDFLPQLPENVLVILAGREPPALPWRTDPGWQTLIQTLPLRNLDWDECQTYLTQRGLPPEEQPAILNFTRGHPLALCLVADAFAQRANTRFNPEKSPEVLKILLEQFVQKVPSPAHRAALEACALVYLTSEPLLAEMLNMPDGHELFAWLRGLSFIESQRGGLLPHDLVRQLLMADLRWRNPKWYLELFRRAQAHYIAQLRQATGSISPQLLFDYIFLHRDNPIARPYMEWQTQGQLTTDAMSSADLPNLTAMVARYEGEDSARLAAYWFARQPEGVHVFRGPDRPLAGFLFSLALHRLTPEDLQTDPAVQRVWDYWQRSAPLKPGQKAIYFRFWMDSEVYQGFSATQVLALISAFQYYLATPDLAFSCLSCADPELWDLLCAYMDMARLPETDFQVNGRTYGTYGHDWRVISPMNWLALMAERELASNLQSEKPQPVVEPFLALSQSDFQEAVRAALRELRYADNETLSTNPLLESRLISQRTGPRAGKPERSAALRVVLKEAADSLKAAPRDVKFYRAVYHTYFQPTPTQQEAANLLNVPFSTYRRHLETGVKRIIELLWQGEISSLER
jgi:hypothetical protein